MTDTPAAPTKTIKVLGVDDDASRHYNLRTQLLNLRLEPGEVLQYTGKHGPGEVAEDDIAAADILFLDHDMCQSDTYYRKHGQRHPEGCPQRLKSPDGFNLLNEWCGCPTGRDMVRRLISLPYRPLTFVHTLNRRGGATMDYALSRAGFTVSQFSEDQWYSADWRTRVLGAYRSLAAAKPPQRDPT